MSQKYIGGFITKSPVLPAGPYETSIAKGMWTLDQAMQFKKQGLWPTAGNPAPLVPGQAYQGGFFAGQISTAGNGIADYNLVVGPAASAQNTSKQFRTSNTSGDPTSVINGPANSAAMNDASHPAAFFCEGLTIGGFSDWYMPAQNELDVCYYNLKPTTQPNNESWGINANAVPARASNYTSGTPAQASATDFQSTGAEAFIANYYWISAEYSPAPTTAWLMTFYSGQRSDNYKNQSFRVRAIRRVAV